MWMRQYKIGARLIAAFGLLSAVLIFQGLMSLQSMSTLRHTAHELEGNTIPSLASLSEINLSVMRARSGCYLQKLRLSAAKVSKR